MDQNVTDLFHRLADCSPAEREDYYARHHVPAGVRAEVESLLRFDGPTNQSLAAHVAFVAEEALENADVPEAVGDYRITSMLSQGGMGGQGGMGKVYRARDTRLGREVAIRMIPAARSQDAGGMARLAREAKVLAALNQPGIAAIYGVEDGALVLELVEGPTLAERIARGAVPLEEALDIAAQIAAVLEAVHKKGIVHCGLKAANVKIKPDGRVKVLDFGLDANLSPGQAVDPRTDIQAFGVILYEMLTGAVLDTEPDWNQVPLKVRPLLRACLEKDPQFQLQAIGNIRQLLEDFPQVRPLPDKTVTVLTPTERSGYPSAASAADFFEGRFLPGTMVAHRYRIVNLLGRGGMGEVYRAMDLTLGQTVALKFLPEAASNQFQARERLFNEVRAAREITHPQVCRVHDIGETDGQLYISMEFVDGEDLASLLSRIGRLPVRKASELAAGICAGLSAAHRRGMIHRDLKPANIMVDGRGQPRLMDFGLTASVGKIARNEVGFGTPMYMAPEQLEGREVTPRSDLYALGLILYELFTGQQPFAGRTMEALLAARERNAPVPMSTLCPEVPPPVEAVVGACLSRDPERRPVSAYAVAAALPYQDALAAVMAAGETPSPELIAASGDPKAVRPILAYGTAAVILIGLAVLYGLRARSGGDREPPEVLLNSAQTVLRQLGYPAKAAATASGFIRTGSLREPEIRFWYRESETDFEPPPVGNFLTVPGRLTPSDPPLQAGMRLIEMDARGRLIRFEAIPQSSPGSNTPIEWKTLFDYAGLDWSQVVEAPAGKQPLVPADSRHRWVVAASPGRRAVRGGSWMGQVVYFDAARSDESEVGPVIREIAPAGTAVLIGIILAAFFFARRNLVQQRGDRKGAFRVGAAMFWVCTGEWLLVARHSFTLREVVLASFGLSWALAMGVLAGVGYLAIDPMLRRAFPNAMISLQQVLTRGRPDAQLGRDILCGLGLAVLITLISGGRAFGGGYNDFSTPRTLAAAWLGDLRLGAWIGLFFLTMLTPLLRMLPRRRGGVLAVIIGETGLFCLRDMPAVHDVAGWYAQAPLLGYAAFALLAIYAARLAAGSNVEGRGHA